MKKIFFAIVLITSHYCFSQNSVTKNLGEFNKVTTFDQIDVILIPADESKIIINGKSASEVEIVNKNGELKVRMPLTHLLKGDDISATIYYNKLDAVEANEGSSIASEAIFKAVSFNIIAKEGSTIKINLDVDKLTVKGSDGSTINVNGKAKTQEVLINSGAVYDAQKLITNQTTITANAGGEADINATEIVDAKVRAGGDITIFGKPKQINQKVIAGGSIKENK